MHFIFSYCGKSSKEETAYYIKGVEKTVRYLQNLQKYGDLQGRNISFDRLYSSVILGTMASISHNTTFVGTLQSNRRDIPIEVKNVAERERFSCQCFWESSENKLVLNSYLFPTKSSGQCNVFLRLTVELILGVTIGDGKKNITCKIYDFTKTCTDVMEYRFGA